MTQLTPDNRFYMVDPSATKTRSFLWHNSRLVLSPGFAWNTITLPGIIGLNPLQGVSLVNGTSATGDSTNFLHTVFMSDNGTVQAGIARSILTIPDTTGKNKVYLPLTQVCTIDKNRARILNHNFEQVTPDQLEGAGHPSDNSGKDTFNVILGSLPAGLSMAQNTGTLTGTMTAPTTNTVVVKNTQSSSNNSLSSNQNTAQVLSTEQVLPPSQVQYYRAHYRRLGFFNTSKFGVSTVNGDNVLPSKLIFNNVDSTVTLPSNAGPDIYGQDSTTNPTGALNYINIIGGAAPYTATITNISAVDANGNAIPLPMVLQPGLSNGQDQWHIGFVNAPTDTPYPLSAGNGLWSYTINAQRFYVKNIANGGSIIAGSTDDAPLPLTLELTIQVVDNTGVTALDPNTGLAPVFTIPVIAAPPLPQVVPTIATLNGLVYQDVVQTGTTYNIPLGVTSPLVTGYPYTTSGASSFFRVDIPWWTPTLTPVTGGYNLTLECNQPLPQGGPYSPTLFERYPTQVNSGNSTYYDYIECQRLLRPFVVAGALSLSYPPGPVTYTVNTPLSILFQVYGGTPPYTWTIGSYSMPGISGSTLNNGTQYIFSGSRIPQTDGNGNVTEVFPISSQIPVTVQDSSKPYVLTTTKLLDITFTTLENVPLVKNPYIKGDFAFYTYTNQGLFLTNRNSFPWTNQSLTTLDYVNDYPDGVLPGGLMSQTGSSSGPIYDYLIQVSNPNPSVWASMKYKMPQGLCFALSSLTSGGYNPVGYFQITKANPASGTESVGQYSANGFTPLSTSSIIYDANGNSIGFNLGDTSKLSLKYGDVIVGAMNKLDNSSDQYWELGYQSPHFELMPSLTSFSPRDNPDLISTAQGDQLSAVLGISNMTYSAQAVSNYTSFLAALKAGTFDTATYQALPQIGGASDTLNITITKSGFAPVSNTIQMPINEDSSSRIWVASADMWGNPSYYWLGQSSTFRTVLDSNSKTLYFGFTECDRILKAGVFPARDSAIFPQIYSSLVNFHLVNADGSPHASNTAFHADSGFITNLKSFISIPSLPLSDLNGYMGTSFNTYLDDPVSDPAKNAYFMGPTKAGFDTTPGNGSALNHTTLTNIDRGYRVSCAVDAPGLWAYLNGLPGTPLAAGTMLHFVMVFLVVRPNIAIGTSQDLLDMDMLVGASGQTATSLANLYLRGKAYARVPIHVILGNGPVPTSMPPLIPSSPGGSVKVYGS